MRLRRVVVRSWFCFLEDSICYIFILLSQLCLALITLLRSDLRARCSVTPLWSLSLYRINYAVSEGEEPDGPPRRRAEASGIDGPCSRRVAKGLELVVGTSWFAGRKNCKRHDVAWWVTMQARSWDLRCWSSSANQYAKPELGSHAM